MTKRFLLCAAALLLASACSNEATGPGLATQPDAARAADTFAHLADSVSRNGGDSDVGGAYAAIAGAVRAAGQVAPITLTIDGVKTSFVATVVVNELGQNVQCVRAPCPPVFSTIRSLIAWDKDNPKRVVQLTSSSDDELIDAMLYPSMLALYAPMASLIYMDGAGGIFLGTSGTQKFVETNTKALCPAVLGDSASAIKSYRRGTCTITNATVTFSAGLEPSPFLTASYAAKGTHTIAMAAQPVPGSHVVLTFPSCDTICTPIGGPNAPPPPVVVRPSNELPAQLSAAVDNNVVTMTLTMKNPSAAPIKVAFSSGQKYDFVVIDSATGREAWRWSADKGFTQALEERTVPASGALVFTEKWTAPKRGLYLVHGVLVATSHRSEAYTTVLVR